MDPLGILKSLVSVATQVHSIVQKVKANERQCQRLAERIQALMPPIQALETKEKERINQAEDASACNAPTSSSNFPAHAPPSSSAQVTFLAPLAPFLEILLLTFYDALALISHFTDQSWLKKLLLHGSYVDRFAEVNADLSRAAADCHLGLALNAGIFSREADAMDAKQDLEEIALKQNVVMAEIEKAESNAEKRFQSEKRWRRELQNSLDQLAIGKNPSTKSDMPSTRPLANTDGVAPTPIEVILSNYPSVLRIPYSDLRILNPSSPIGSGGFGDVYCAEWMSRDMTVAVKQLRIQTLTPTMVADFMNEVSFLASLPHHSNVLKLHGICVNEAQQRCLMVVDWMANGSIFQLLRKYRAEEVDVSLLSVSDSLKPTLNLQQRLNLCLQCCRAVSHLHLLPPPIGPILHRDLKSLNFLVDEQLDTKVADFGLARVRQNTSFSSFATFPMSVAGSLLWTAPELLSIGAQKRVSTASDVFSLAVTLWEIVSMQIPYEGDSDALVKAAVQSGERLPLPDFAPPKLKALIEAGWHHNPAMRPSAQQMALAIKELLGELAPGVEVSLAPRTPVNTAVMVNAASPQSSNTGAATVFGLSSTLSPNAVGSGSASSTDSPYPKNGHQPPLIRSGSSITSTTWRKFVRNDGSTYTGEMDSANQRHGFGSLVHFNGIIEEGYWVNDQLDGIGMRVCPSTATSNATNGINNFPHPPSSASASVSPSPSLFVASGSSSPSCRSVHFGGFSKGDVNGLSLHSDDMGGWTLGMCESVGIWNGLTMWVRGTGGMQDHITADGVIQCFSIAQFRSGVLTTGPRIDATWFPGSLAIGPFPTVVDGVSVDDESEYVVWGRDGSFQLVQLSNDVSKSGLTGCTVVDRHHPRVNTAVVEAKAMLEQARKIYGIFLQQYDAFRARSSMLHQERVPQWNLQVYENFPEQPLPKRNADEVVQVKDVADAIPFAKGGKLKYTGATINGIAYGFGSTLHPGTGKVFIGEFVNGIRSGYGREFDVIPSASASASAPSPSPSSSSSVSVLSTCYEGYWLSGIPRSGWRLDGRKQSLERFDVQTLEQDQPDEGRAFDRKVRKVVIEWESSGPFACELNYADRNIFDNSKFTRHYDGRTQLITSGIGGVYRATRLPNGTDIFEKWLPSLPLRFTRVPNAAGFEHPEALIEHGEHTAELFSFFLWRKWLKAHGEFVQAHLGVLKTFPSLPLTDFMRLSEPDDKQSRTETNDQLSQPGSASAGIQLHYRDGSSYVGQVLNGKRHGIGKCWQRNGVTWEGEWSNDQRHGWGIERGLAALASTNSSSPSSSSSSLSFSSLDSREGYWRFDVLHGSILHRMDSRGLNWMVANFVSNARSGPIVFMTSSSDLMIGHQRMEVVCNDQIGSFTGQGIEQHSRASAHILFLGPMQGGRPHGDLLEWNPMMQGASYLAQSFHKKVSLSVHHTVKNEEMIAKDAAFTVERVSCALLVRIETAQLCKRWKEGRIAFLARLNPNDERRVSSAPTASSSSSPSSGYKFDKRILLSPPKCLFPTEPPSTKSNHATVQNHFQLNFMDWQKEAKESMPWKP